MDLERLIKLKRKLNEDLADALRDYIEISWLEFHTKNENNDIKSAKKFKDHIVDNINKYKETR